MAEVMKGNRVLLQPGANTTIGLVATNVAMEKIQITKVAQMAHDGYGRAINPAHTTGDGDTIFALATGTLDAKANHGLIGALAAEAMAQAIVRAATQAETSAGIPGLRDWKRG
jgi:L-aminopeptidase/D-esterase-like protein